MPAGQLQGNITVEGRYAHNGTFAALLHIGTAILMRLNTFLWAFLATYPAVIYCATT
ncbi:hypothetical protein KHQ06_28615 [Nocardia tengchongensis]|uniref:Uncharacterized protein n=1 Tax=Nocardia tengchongensis TaxID=2055889 RepID=A0ABX8CLA5_9NOCA|nr:hypothetical protein [Nocardia tengchongensis]QVI20172.1 hypothetical protein KHQ06_28615 [Nocardia tengchongensis]